MLKNRRQSDAAHYKDHYRAVLDNLPFPAWLKDTESRFLAVNDVFARTFGAPSAESLIGKTDFDIAPRELAEAYRADDRRVITTRQKRMVEEEIIDRGVHKCFETYKAPVLDQRGELIGTVGFAKDISELVKNARELREREERFRLIFENSGEAIVFAWADGRVESANQAACRLFGYSEEDFRRLGRAGLMDISDPNLADAIATRLRDGRFHGELRCLRQDGTVFDVDLISTLFTDAKGEIRSITQFRDISERKKAEKLQQENRQRVSLALSGADLGMWDWHVPSGRITVDERWVGMLGETLDEFANHSSEWSSRVHPDDQSVIQENWTKLLDPATSSFTSEYRMRHKDGHWVWIQDRGKVLERDAGGQPVLLLGTHLDISSRKQADEEIRLQARRLEAMSRHLVATQEEFRRRLSADLHDRTSPNLAALTINLSLIAGDLKTGQISEIAGRVEDTRALLEDTTASIREISGELRPPLLDYAGLVPAMESYSTHFSRRTSIPVSINCPHAALLLDTETESLLFRIVQEALTNCAKHSGATAVEIKLQRQGDTIELTISDNGSGFAWESSGIQRFGSGLGLINMKEMAQFAGGTFALDSQPGHGTRLHIRIPVARGEE